jgi:hypothetical protein
MTTGYPLQELNTEADTIYAGRFLSRLFEQVQHTWLKQLDMNIAETPLEENLIVAYRKEPSSWVDKGRWRMGCVVSDAPRPESHRQSANTGETRGGRSSLATVCRLGWTKW